jgi:prepilin-type processing-associated H-X9-DG protein
MTYNSPKLGAEIQISYITNYGYAPSGSMELKTLSDVPEPHRLIAYAEMRDAGDWPGWNGFWGAQPYPNDYAVNFRRLTYEEVLSDYRTAKAKETPAGQGKKLAPRLATERHQGGANYVFADGHVKWMRFWDTVDPEGWRTTKNWLWSQDDTPPN